MVMSTNDMDTWFIQIIYYMIYDIDYLIYNIINHKLGTYGDDTWGMAT